MRQALRALEQQADYARFRPTAPFYLESPDRTRESIARVFRARHLPARLDATVRNEIDALLVVLAIEARLWMRSLRLPVGALIDRWYRGLRAVSIHEGLSDAFFDRLRFLLQPHRGENRERSLTISFPAEHLSLRTRLQLVQLAELVEVAERLALFTDEPRPDEQGDEAGDLRRALRQDVQLSVGSAERCVVRVPRLRRNQFEDAVGSLFAGTFLPFTPVPTGHGVAVENDWMQIIVERVVSDEAPSDRAVSLVDRIKGAARRHWREFCELNGFGTKPLAAVSAQQDVSAFLEGDKPALVILGPGGSGKTTLVRQVGEERHEGRTVLVFPLRNRREISSVAGLLRTAIGAPVADDFDLLKSTSEAFAIRGEELVVVVEGLNEISDGEQAFALYQSLFEAAEFLSEMRATEFASRPGMRLILTSRQETYFAASLRLGSDPPHRGFHRVPPASGREPRPYIEIGRLSQEEREKLFGVYFEEFCEAGAEQEITRATRGDHAFAAILSRPIMIVLASELYKRGVAIQTLRSSLDLVDLMIEQGFERLVSPERVSWAWRTLENIFERRLRLGESDMIKFEDLWAAAPADRKRQVLAVSDLCEMGILQPFLGEPQRIVSFVHDRIEENLLGRYLSRLHTRRPPQFGSSDWYDVAVETCLVLSGGKTVYEEALTYHLREALGARLSESGDRSPTLPSRWAILGNAAARSNEYHRLARVLARSLLDLSSGPRSSELGDRWLAKTIEGLGGDGRTVAPLVGIEEVIGRLLEGMEALLKNQVPGLKVLALELRSAVRGFIDDPSLELRSALLVAESQLQSEDWTGALEHLKNAASLMGRSAENALVDRFRRARGTALRSIGRIREAADDLNAVLDSQLGRDVGEAIATLPSVMEAKREFGDFAGGLQLIEFVEQRAGAGISRRDRLRLALWRGILNKNLMQDAIQFRWSPEAGSLVPAIEEARRFRRGAEDALGKALDIAAAVPPGDSFGALLPDTIQVHSELAETALWYSILRADALEETDHRLEALARLLALSPAVEAHVEYHRGCAQRAALDRRFDDARASLEQARRLAQGHRMKFLEADCDMDWARFIANDPGCFTPADIRGAADRIGRVLTYYTSNIGGETYYPRIVGVLLAALDGALMKAGVPS